MDVFCLLLYFLPAALIIYLLYLFLRSDGDPLLLLYEKIGKSPAVLRGKVVWITGASSGIGEYLAYELAKNGCKLVLSARRTDKLEAVKTECLKLGGSVLDKSDILVLPLDVTEFQTHAECMEVVLKYFKKVDILVNNAGRMHLGQFEKTPFTIHQQLFDTNVFSAVSMTKAVLPHMMERHEGHIVVMSSCAGKMAVPNNATYAASKHALQGWFLALQSELYDYNIDVTLICPGPVISEIRQHALREEVGKFGYTLKSTQESAVKTERCAYLTTVAIANRLSEAWIAMQPFLFFIFVFQYFPVYVQRVMQKLKINKAVRDASD